MLIKLLHITLIFSLLSSSVGVVLNQHFCQDELKEVSLYKAVKNCHESNPKKQRTCPHHPPPNPETRIDTNACCHDTSDYLKSQQEQQVELDLLPDVVHATYAFPLANWTATLHIARSLSDKYYRPPPLPKDFPSFFQVYRL